VSGPMIIPSNMNFHQYADIIGDQESQEIHKATHWIDEVAEFSKRGHESWGDPTPWAKVNDLFRFRPGELTLWAGYSGHKKSLLSGYVAMFLMLQHNKIVSCASMELHPKETLYRMACNAAGCDASEAFSRKFISSLENNMAIYDQQDTVPMVKIFGFVAYSAKELNADHILIDSLTKCGIRKDDTSSEKEFVDRAQWLAKTTQKHIHLVCHMRKPDGQQGERKMPTKQDIRGASEIADLADNVIIVWSDPKKKELREKFDRGKTMTDGENKYLERPDVILGFDKQRHGPWEGKLALWHKRNQFLAGESMAIQTFGEL
jgi:twinkle protein